MIVACPDLTVVANNVHAVAVNMTSSSTWIRVEGLILVLSAKTFSLSTFHKIQIKHVGGLGKTVNGFSHAQKARSGILKLHMITLSKQHVAGGNYFSHALSI